MERSVWDCAPSRFLVALALTLGLWGLQPSLPLWAQTPGIPEPVAPGVHLDEYDNLEIHPEGRYLLRREGAQVTATFTSVGSAVQYAARQKPEVLFTVPIGFRPQEQETREVDGWPLSDGVLDPAILIPVRFRVQVAPTGEVRYLNGPELETVGHLAYVMVATWTTPDILGRYDNQAAHHEGAYSLRRTGAQVTAQLRTTRSPVQHFARQAPEVLFTVPAGYRPAHEVQLEVTALQPVNEEGISRAELPATRSFRVQVAPNGEVRYVDDAGVDEVGYLAYEAEVSWYTSDPPLSRPPATPAEAADLCDRHAAVQAGLRASLVQDGTWSCQAVTWTDLARVEHLDMDVGPGHPPLKAQDLAGLTGLTSLKLQLPNPSFRFQYQRSRTLDATYHPIRRWPADLLTQTPNLRHLEVQWARGRLPVPLLKTVPQLALARRDVENLIDEILSEEGEARRALARQHRFPHTWLGAFLSHAPQLTRLTLRNVPEVAASWLVHNHELRELTLEGGMISVMPADMLRHQQKLEHLAVLSQKLDELPSRWLAHNPRLQTLELRMGNPGVYDYYGSISLPRDLLAHSPQLRRFSLESDSYLRELPIGLLQHNPLLQVLNLKVDRLLSSFPSDLLRYSPQLQILHVTSYRREALPANFLAHNPQLRELSLNTGSEDVPGDLLQHTPNLETLDLGDSTQVPQEFLIHTPNLQELTIAVRGVLPADLLIPVPHLQTLDLRINTATRIPADLLSHVPRLIHFSLNYEGELPADLLAHSPRLQSLRLWSRYQKSLPTNLLAHNPQLRSLEVTGASLTAILSDFLAHNPQLRSLEVTGESLTAIPSNFLAHNPQLRTLEVTGESLTAIPSDFLAHNPQLQSLSVHADRLWSLPPNLLAHNHQLQSLSVSANRLWTLPPNLLAHNPQLQSLTVNGTHLSHLPADFLEHNLQLQTLVLWSEALYSLPPHFLSSNALLQELRLFVPHIGVVPTHLRDNYCLKKLGLQMYNVMALGPGILRNVPCLQSLYLSMGPSFELPPDFLAYAPQLQDLTLSRAPLAVLSDLLAVAPHLRQFDGRLYSFADRLPR